MAKKKDESIEEAETNKSLGAQMKTKLTQRQRNLAVKAEMIEKGEREEPTVAHGQTQRERNLAIKKELTKGKDKDEKGKPKTSR
jgi:hypothetical protein